MNQEDYNDMMMTPEEGYAYRHPRHTVLPRCPICGEKYTGDGISLCVECEASRRHSWQGGAMTSYLRCNEREPGISLALDIRNELTLAESARAICSFADEIRRECADRLEAWWLDDDTELSMALDENINAIRAAIMGKEAGE